MRTNLNDMTSEIMAEARIGKNRSQQYMAKALGRSLTTIQNWESGISIPKLSDMGAWFGALGVNPMRSCLELSASGPIQGFDTNQQSKGN